jgi:excisionase family DNA binding protein
VSQCSASTALLDSTPHLLTLDEAAARARVATCTMRRWAKAGRFPSRRLPGPNGKILIPQDAVDALFGEVPA